MRKLILAAGLTVASLLSGQALAAPCAGFTDVDDSSPFCTNVHWMKNRAITIGCTATSFCPNDFVTRLSMAAFLHRFANAITPLSSGSATPLQNADLTPSGSTLYCAQPDFAVGNFTMTAHGHAVVSARGTGGWANVGVWFVESVDGGAFDIASPVQLARVEEGEPTTIAVFLAPRPLGIGSTYRYGLRIALLDAGTTNQGQVQCEMRLLFENRNSPFTPIDPAP